MRRLRANEFPIELFELTGEVRPPKRGEYMRDYDDRGNEWVIQAHWDYSIDRQIVTRRTLSKPLPEEPCTPDCTDCVNVGECLSEAGTGNEIEIGVVGSPEERAASMRIFGTGATRNVDDDNHDYEGFLSPLVVKRFGEYMHGHRKQADGNIRASDNWQKGIPLDSYMKSGWRHFFDWWCGHRKVESRDDLETALCALLFNVQGYLHETLKKKAVEDLSESG